MKQTSDMRDTLLAPATIGDLLLYRLSVITRSTSLPLVRLFEGRYGITRRHWHLLALVVENSALSAADICQKSWLDRPQISRGLDGLIKMGLLGRQKMVGSAMRFVATEKGQALYAEAFPKVAELNHKLTGLLSAEERQVLDTVLSKLQAEVASLARQEAELVPSASRSRGKGERGW